MKLNEEDSKKYRIVDIYSNKHIAVGKKFYINELIGTKINLETKE
jgi:hypothetical protein